MNGLLLFAIAAVIIGTVAKAIVRPERFYEFPYFMMAVFGAFILPQAVSLVNYPGEASPGAVTSVLVMTLFCVIACVAGYQVAANKWVVEHASIPVDYDRLLAGGIAYVLIAYYFTYLISDMTFEERGGGVWSGKVTIYQFFSGLIYPGLAICLSHALRQRSQSAWAMVFIAAVLPCIAIIFYGRREEAALLAMTLALTVYFQRRRVVPRIAILGALVVATVLIPGTSQYRAAMNTGDYSRLQKFDFVDNFWQYLNKAQILELRNAAMIIEATQASGNFGYGSAYWDQMVFRFVPAQIIGRDLKEGIMFHPPKRGVELGILQSRYKRPMGTTLTGVGDSFHEFWYFGALFFAVLAIVFKSLWKASLESDGMFAQLLYIQTSTAAMRAVTHQTVDYPPGLAYNLVFIGALVYFARAQRQDAPSGVHRLEDRPA